MKKVILAALFMSGIAALIYVVFYTGDDIKTAASRVKRGAA